MNYLLIIFTKQLLLIIISCIFNYTVQFTQIFVNNLAVIKIISNELAFV